MKLQGKYEVVNLETMEQAYFGDAISYVTHYLLKYVKE